LPARNQVLDPKFSLLGISARLDTKESKTARVSPKKDPEMAFEHLPGLAAFEPVTLHTYEMPIHSKRSLKKLKLTSI